MRSKGSTILVKGFNRPPPALSVGKYSVGYHQLIHIAPYYWFNCWGHRAFSVAYSIVWDNPICLCTFSHSFNTTSYLFYKCTSAWLCSRMPDLQSGGWGFESQPGYLAPRSTQPSIPPGSVNEYQLRLGRQRRVGWGLRLIPIADETQGVTSKTVLSLDSVSK